MGVEWLYWGSGGGGGSNGGGRSMKFRRTGGQIGDTPSGCMSSFFQLFDLSKFHLAFHHQVPSFKPDSFLPEEPTILKGVEAPRNSLEMEQEKPSMEADSSLSTMKEKGTLNIPMGTQIKTSGGAGKSKLGSPKSRSDDFYSECSNSPGAKTPNLVARLMGLDLLPHSCSPSSSSSNPSTSNPPLKPLLRPHQLQILNHDFRSRQLVQTRQIVGKTLFDDDIAGARSLPETPRISSERRSDVDHRLSLQINKENIGLADELEFWGYSSNNNSRLKTSRRRSRQFKQEDGSTSRGRQSRQIVKQERETDSNGVCYVQSNRKVCMDVTNTIENRREKEREDFVVLLKAMKAVTAALPSPPPPPPLSSLPVSRGVLSKQKSPWKKQETQEEEKKNRNRKCEKIVRDNRIERRKKAPRTPDVIRKKQEEPFVHSSVRNRAENSDRKRKKVSVASEIVNININAPPRFQANKDRPDPITKRLPQKQVFDSLPSKIITLLPSCSSQAYEPERTKTLAAQGGSYDGDTSNGTTTGDGEEFQYIAGILKRTGIETNPPLSFAEWYHSPTHPIHPSIFHRLELSAATIPAANYSRLRHRRSRKLIFDLVNEILAEILRPFVNPTPWISPTARDHDQMNGFPLICAICSKIRSFQSVGCLVLDDIDALVEKDLRLRTWMAMEEEGEGIVTEIGREIVETLVHETAIAIFLE